jgi:Domain of unknown function (DUF3786)
LDPILKKPEHKSPPGFSRREAELCSILRPIPAELLAARTGSTYLPLGMGSGEFHLPFFEMPLTGSYPELKFYSPLGELLPEFQQLLLLYYFVTADGSVPIGQYVSFADLPGGRMYAQAFQGYSGDEVVRVFGENIAAFKDACEHENGEAVNIADGAYIFPVLPKVSVQLVYWLGDEDFPSSCKILFDAAATHFVPIDGCAIIGSNMAQRLIRNYRAKKSETIR